MLIVNGQKTRCLDYLRTSPQARCLSTSLKHSGLASHARYVKTWHARDLLSTQQVAATSIPVWQKATLTTSSTLRSRLRPIEQKWLRSKNNPRFRQQAKDKEDFDELYTLPTESRSKHLVSTTSAGPSQPVSLTPEELSQQQATYSFQPFVLPAKLSGEIPFFAQQIPLKMVQQLEPKQKPNHAIPRHEASVTALEQELHHISHHDPHPTAIQRILQILIFDRNIKPQTHHYEALILSNTWPESGSSENIRAIMLEMERESVTMGVGVYTAMLKVLAIHPDTTLTGEILQRMERSWVSVTFEMKLYLLIGLVRTGQMELASEFMGEMYRDAKTARLSHGGGGGVQTSSPSMLSENDMSKKGTSDVVVPGYIHVLFIRTLLETSSRSTISHSTSFPASSSPSSQPLPPEEQTSTHDWSGIYSYLTRLYDRTSGLTELTSIPTEFWVWLLTESTRDKERWVSEWTWWTFLSPRKTKIDGLRESVVMDLLEIASHQGRVRLAEDVIGYLRFVRNSHHDNDSMILRSDQDSKTNSESESESESNSATTENEIKKDTQTNERERQENRLLKLARSNSLKWGNMRSWPGDNGVTANSAKSGVDNIRRVQISPSTFTSSISPTSEPSFSPSSAPSSTPSLSSSSPFQPFSSNSNKDNENLYINPHRDENDDDKNENDNEFKIKNGNRNKNGGMPENESKNKEKDSMINAIGDESEHVNVNENEKDVLSEDNNENKSPLQRQQWQQTKRRINEWDLYRPIPGVGNPVFDAWNELKSKK